MMRMMKTLKGKIKLKKRTIYYLTFLWLVLFFSICFIEYSEIKKAKEYCDSVDGNYKFKIIHLCNDTPIYKYSFKGKKFWSFEIPDLENIKLNWSIVEELDDEPK